MTFLSLAADWAHSTVEDAAGVPVTYSRPSAGQSVSIEKAVKGKTPLETTSAEGVTVQSQVTDWIIQASQIVLGGIQTLPAEGDLITFVNQGTTEIYQALPIGSEKCFQPSDHLGNRLRIHTRLSG